MQDWSGETQVYVRWQKAAEEQKRFDKAKTLSCLASRDHPGGTVSPSPDDAQSGNYSGPAPRTGVVRLVIESARSPNEVGRGILSQRDSATPSAANSSASTNS